jgi:hypothetical protein
MNKNWSQFLIVHTGAIFALGVIGYVHLAVWWGTEQWPLPGALMGMRNHLAMSAILGGLVLVLILTMLSAGWRLPHVALAIAILYWGLSLFGLYVAGGGLSIALFATGGMIYQRYGRQAS